MPNKILDINTSSNSISEFLDCTRQGIPSAIFGVNDSFKNYLVSLLESKVLFIVKDNITANIFRDYITSFCNKKVGVLPCKDETLLVNRAFSKDSVYERISTIENINNLDVIISTIEAISIPFPKKIMSFTFAKDKSYSREEILSFLISSGYKRVDSVESKGTFSLRGDVLDIFAIDKDNPFRIDFFDDQVESIKQFDAESRENLGFINSVKIIQAVEFAFTDSDLNELSIIIKEDIKNFKGESHDRIKTILGDVELFIENKDYEGLSSLVKAISLSTNFSDLLPSDTIVVFDEAKRINEIANLSYTEFTERYNSLVLSGDVFSFEKENYLSVDAVKSELKKYRQVALQTLSSEIPFFSPLRLINPVVSGVADYRLDVKEAFLDIRNWTHSNYTVTVCTGDIRHAENFIKDLASNQIIGKINADKKVGVVNLVPQKLDCGFVFHEEKEVLIGSGNIFTKPVSSRKLKSKKQSFFTAPEIGDYCVHEIHGIGRALGNKKITTSEGTKDYIAVEYSGGDILYVPVEQMDILTRYLGGEKPKLSKIGGKDFDRIKQAVKESIKRMSFDLKKLYEERNAISGFKFRGDKELQNLFLNDFPYEDTVDQAQATEDIISDMESGKIMDRLICGDVGFGKTEVAFRGAFLSILNGKQVAMLAPTTILAEQHFNTAKERFKNFGVKIACLNRFKTTREQEKIIEKVKSGDIDFVIGTHRLLSKDIAFKDLGLLILDEEQRFGVEHKEKIKLLKKNVDTLTLTATPIPRTLHMSLSGIRSISTINTPPKKRLPVQTYVTEETDSLIKDAVMREMNRGGQSFILYNRVESIFTFAKKISDILSNVKIAVVHGQMEEKIMEKNIIDFYSGKYDLLISTTIIENGIDLPKANTLIVIDADRLGLSTLYQLKGRVGRSDRLAYAYFTFKREKVLTETAYNRLNAIVEFAEMGSGIKIAMRDLEIRGAGNVLGAEQHGHMNKIGYELYSKLLKEELEGKEDFIADLDIRVSAFIPEEYIESRSARMDAYKEIAEISTVKDELDVKSRLIDAFGSIPEEVNNLITVAIVKSLAKQYGTTEITVSKESTNLVFNHFNAFNNPKIVNAMNNSGIETRIVMTEKPMLEFSQVFGGKTALDTLREFLTFAEENN